MTWHQGQRPKQLTLIKLACRMWSPMKHGSAMYQDQWTYLEGNMTWIQGVAPRTAMIFVDYKFPTAPGLGIQERWASLYTIGLIFRAPPTPNRREFPLYHTASNLSSKICEKNAQILNPGIVHFDGLLQYAKVSATGGRPWLEDTDRPMIRTGQLKAFCLQAVDTPIDTFLSILLYRFVHND